MKALKLFHDREMKEYDRVLFEVIFHICFRCSRGEMRGWLFGKPTNNNCSAASQALSGLLEHGLVEKDPPEKEWGGPDLFFMTLKGSEEYLFRCKNYLATYDHCYTGQNP